MFGLNAPFGARCFLTEKSPRARAKVRTGLNAPFGARCFLTGNQSTPQVQVLHGS